MIAGLEMQFKGDVKDSQKANAYFNDKQSSVKEKGFVKLLEKSMVPSNRADNESRQLNLADDTTTLVSSEEVDVREVAGLASTDVLVLWGQIVESLLNLAQMERIPQDSLTKLEEYINEKMAIPALDSSEKDLPISEFISKLENQLAAMIEEMALKAEMAARFKETILQKVQELLNNQGKLEQVLLIKSEVPEDKAGLFSISASRGLIVSDEKSKLENNSVVSTSNPESNDKKDVKELIQFEQMKMTGRKMEKVDKEQFKTDESLADKKDFHFTGENNRSLLEPKKLTSFLNTQRQMPVNTKEVFEQIVKKAELMVKQGLSEMKIELKPEFLGKMTIKIVVEEGTVTAKFLAENIRVKQILESNITALKQSLENQGLRVEKTEVNVQLNNSSMFDGSENNRHFLWQRPEFSSTIVNDELVDNINNVNDGSTDSIIGGKEFYETGILDSTMSWLV